jgi:hypothetical protein
MVGSLKSGAWLVVEEVDTVTWLPDPHVYGASLFSKAISAFGQVQAAAGVDESYGRRLYGDVRAAGLIDVDGEGHVPLIHAGAASARMWQLTMAQRRPQIAGAGLLTDEEMDRFLALFSDSSFVAMDFMVMTVWGRKPE